MKFKRSRKQMSPGMQKCKDYYGSKKGRIPTPFNKGVSSPKKAIGDHDILLSGANDANAPANNTAPPMKKVSALKNMMRKDAGIKGIPPPPTNPNKRYVKDSGVHTQIIKGTKGATENIVDDTGDKQDMFMAFAAQTADMNDAAYNTSSVEEWDAEQQRRYQQNAKKYQHQGADDIAFQGGNWLDDLQA